MPTLKNIFTNNPDVDLGDFSLLEKPMPDLVPRKRKIWGMGKPLGGCPDCELPELVPFYDTDGKLLVMEAKYHGDLYYHASFFGGACIAIAIFLLFTNTIIALSVASDPSTKSLLFASGWVLLLGIVVYFASNYLTKTGYIIFDREHSTVMLPVKHQGRRWVLPFKDIQCYGLTRILKSYIGYETYLMSLSKPRGAKEFKQHVKIGFYLTRQGAEMYWRVVENFMDKSRPIPDVIPFPDRIRWFKARNTSIAEYYKYPRPFDFPLTTVDALTGDELEEALSKIKT